MKQERVKYRECPLCSSLNIPSFVIGDCSSYPRYVETLSSKIVWNKCEDCTHVFTEGYYTEEALKLILKQTHKNQKVGANLEKNRLISSRIINQITPFHRRGVWLDVGFGNGSLIFTASEYGFETVGLDLREQTVNAMKNLGFDCYQKDICDFSCQKDISVISMADVLEHTHFPKDVLLAAKKLIKKKGALFLSMPNSDSFIWKITSQKNVNPYWGEMEHYHNFSRTRLFTLLESVGFTPVSYSISERYRMCMEIVAISE